MPQKQYLFSFKRKVMLRRDLKKLVIELEFLRVNWRLLISRRLKYVVELRIKQDNKETSTFSTIAQNLHISRSQAWQLQARAIIELEKIYNEQLTENKIYRAKIIITFLLLPYLERLVNIAEQVLLQRMHIESISHLPIEDLHLSTRAYNCLHRCQINTIADILQHKDELDFIKNLGQKSIDEILTACSKQLSIAIESKQ